MRRRVRYPNWPFYICRRPDSARTGACRPEAVARQWINDLSALRIGLDAAQNHAEPAIALVCHGAAIDGPERNDDLAGRGHQIEPYFLPTIGPLIDAPLFHRAFGAYNRVAGQIEYGNGVIERLAARLVAGLELDVASPRGLHPCHDPVNLIFVQPAELAGQGVEAVLRRGDDPHDRLARHHGRSGLGLDIQMRDPGPLESRGLDLRQ